MNESAHPVEYDRCGRMKYNPDLHDMQGKPWTDDEKEYLINWYIKIGMEEMSLALDRTEGTIAQKVNQLRSQGKMSYEPSNNIVRELKPKVKNRNFNPNGRPRKLNVDIEVILKLKETKTYKEIADMFNVSEYLIVGRVRAYKKATKDLAKVSQVAMHKNSTSLYHKEGGMQVVSQVS